MASKYHLVDNNYYYDNSDVPINKFDIHDKETLHEIEKELLEDAYAIFFEELTTTIDFDEEYFKTLHRRTFESLYAWAGIYRDFNMAKGDSRFCQGAYVANASKKIFQELSQDNYLKEYEPLEKKELFAHKLAYYLCELNALHPFYELNGRVTRLFIDMIAAYNGYEFIDYSHITSQEYIQASIECVQFADASKLETILLQGLHK